MLNSIQSLKYSQRSFQKGQAIFHLGDNVTSMFLIVSGEALLTRTHSSGRVVVLQRGILGSILAEASLFSDHYHCDASAALDLTVRQISVRDLRNLFETNADFSKTWAKHLGEEIRKARMRSEILALRTVAERVDFWLTFNGEVPDKGNWKPLADEIAVSPEALYREIAKRRFNS